MAARAGLGVVGVGVVVALIAGAWGAIAPELRAPDRSESVSGSVAQPAQPALASRSRAPSSAAAILPSIPEGRRELGDSMYAIRDGAQVTVYFDTETLRTRFDWKFEGVVRATLPLLFGPDARVALDSIPTGMFVRGGHLMNDLPTRGIPLQMGAHTIHVWPVTRQGRDGPLVMGYRAAGAR